MKNIIFYLVLLLSALFFMSNNVSEAAIPCPTVKARASSCAAFAVGLSKIPSSLCCNGLRQIAQSTKSVDDKKAVCRCLEASVKAIPGVKDENLSQIPRACGINVGFPISSKVNCETIR